MKYIMDTCSFIWYIETSDRIITATAITEGYTLLTNDSEILKYQNVKTLW